MKTNNYRSEGARLAGRRSQQDKAYRASRATIQAAEDRFDATRQAWEADSRSDALYADWQAARAELDAVDPRNGRFT